MVNPSTSTITSANGASVNNDGASDAGRRDSVLSSARHSITRSSGKVSSIQSSCNSLKTVEAIKLQEKREDGISATAMLINFLKGMTGPIALSLSINFKQAGLWTGFALVFLIGYMSNHCMHQIVRCSQKLAARKGKPSLTYGGLVHEAFATGPRSLRRYAYHAKFFINSAIIVMQIGVCCVQYIFIASHLKELSIEYFDFRQSVKTWMFIIFLPMIAVNLLHTLQAISVLSAVGNALMLATYILIFKYLMTPPFRTHEVPAFNNFSGILSASGSILYAFEGQCMVLPMENGLKHPQDMTSRFGVLSTGMALVTILNAGLGFLGYTKFGDAVEESITLNMPKNPTYTLVKVIFTVTSFFNFVIQEYVIADVLWPKISKRLSARFDKSQTRIFVFAEKVLRVFLVAIVAIISLLMPNLTKIMPLVGFSAGMLIAFIFPIVIHTIVIVIPQFHEYRAAAATTIPASTAPTPTMSMLRSPVARLTWTIARNALIFSAGCFGIIGGLYETMKHF